MVDNQGGGGLADFSENGSDNGEIEMTQEQRDDGLFLAVKENDIENAIEFIAKQASPTVEKDGWNPLLWAACNGNEEIVRLLIKNNAHTQYLPQQVDEQVQNIKMSSMGNGDEAYDPFVKPKDAGKVGRYTPMHWASYKCHYKVVWILLKAHLSPLEIDMHGNTAVHQAAASPDAKILKCFMSQGVDVNLKNARGHTPLDLATADETRQLIIKAQQTLTCKGRNCGGSKFDFKNIRFYCENCTNFFCRKCSESNWVYENHESENKERPVCYCYTCLEKIKKSESELKEAMETEEFSVVDRVYTRILNDKVDIDVKLAF